MPSKTGQFQSSATFNAPSASAYPLVANPPELLGEVRTESCASPDASIAIPAGFRMVPEDVRKKQPPVLARALATSLASALATTDEDLEVGDGSDFVPGV